MCLVPGALLLAACGGESDSAEPSTSAAASTVPASTAGTASATTDTGTATTQPSASGKPTVDSLPTLPVTELGVTDLREGTGAAAAEGDTVIVDYVGVRAEDGTEFDNSYDTGQAFPVGPLGTASVIDGWNQGLVGIKVGGLRQLDIPSALAYGDAAQGDVIQANDDLTFLVEVRAIIPATNPDDEPEITIEPTTGSAELSFTDLVEGTGDEVTEGSRVAVHYLAFNGADGTELDSSWQSGSPLAFTVGSGEVLAGFDEGVLGMQVGGRRQVVIPAELAFGAAGNESLGLDAGADLIMVFDLLATY